MLKTGDFVQFKECRLRVIGITRIGEVLCEDDHGNETRFPESQLRLLEGVTDFREYREVRLMVRRSENNLLEARDIAITGKHIRDLDLQGYWEIVVRDGKFFMAVPEEV